MTAPATALSGGLLPGFCPGIPSPADLLKPGAEGMAAKIKAEEADAKARRAAVRYLGTVDCHFWPEVKAVLINSLRADRNECVRWEAAMALGRGCCCAKETLEALSITISGSERDGNPAETSERVKSAAADALELCLSRLAPPAPTPSEPFGPPRERSTPPREMPAPGVTQQALLPVYYSRLEPMAVQQVADQARAALSKRHEKRETAVATVNVQDRSLYGVLVSARHAANRVPEGSVQTAAIVLPTPVAAQAGAKIALAKDKPTPAVEPPLAVVTTAIRPAQAQIVSVPIKPIIGKETANSSKPAKAEVPKQAASVAPANLTPPASEFPKAGATSATLDQILAVLQKSSSIEQREWAADNLAQLDWHENRVAVQALIFAAQQDAAPAVRLACIRCLAQMGASTPSVTATCRVLRYDPDNRVRQEAALALAKLSNTTQTTMDNGIKQTGTAGRSEPR
jgi:hypothetical protein